MITLSLKPAELAEATPPEIDADLFLLLQEEYRALDARAEALLELHTLLDTREHTDRYSYSYSVRSWKLSNAEVVAKAEYALGGQPHQSRTEEILHGRMQQVLHDAYRRYQDAVLALADVKAARLPLDAEYTRRGGWTRAYLVDNADGHLHKSDRCPTLHKGAFMTRLFWITEVSGQDEAQIVEAAGEKACTTCYPSAPVNVLKRPSRFEGPNMKAAREGREARNAEKAARDAVKAEKAITNPDGSVLRGKYGRINTVVTAWRELIDDIFSHHAYEYHLNPMTNDRIVAALAAKTGQTEAQICAEAEKKVIAKAKREGRSQQVQDSLARSQTGAS